MTEYGQGCKEKTSLFIRYFAACLHRQAGSEKACVKETHFFLPG
jgi:hypothetical protein